MLKLAFQPDTHRPYHCIPAVSLFLEVMRDFKPDVLVNQGDIADFYKISNFGKDPRREHSFDSEVESVNEGFDELDALGATRKIFIEGNHEYRLMRYLQDKAPELFSFIDVPKLFKLEERGWEYVPYKTSIQLGKLWLTHDVGSAGRYATFRAADTFQHPVAVAHTHRMNYIVEGNATGESFVATQFGWLGDVNKVDYMHKVRALREWALGFGIGYMDTDGVVYLQPVPIIHRSGVYSCVVLGKKYETTD